LTQTRQAFVGAAFFATDLPFFILMQRMNKNRERW
jgi:hypothetical protein